MRLPILVAYITGVLCITLSEAGAVSARSRTEITGDLQQLRTLAASPAHVGDRFRPLHLKARLYGVGWVNVTLNRRKVPAAKAVFVTQGTERPDRTIPTLLGGSALLNRSRGPSRRVPVAASIIENSLTIQFAKRSHSLHRKSTRFVSVKTSLSVSQALPAKVSSKPDAVFHNKACSTLATQKASSYSLQSDGGSGVELFKLITLSTDADAEWYAKYGDQSNAEIAATINAAEIIYQEQLGIRFALVKQHVYTDTSPYADLEASTLLTSFRKNPDNSANLSMNPLTFDQDVDAKYLFTGKELNGNTVGLSYIGALCWSPKDAYGLIQNVYREVNISAFLHEMGHTLGAQHDTSDPQGIMYPELAPGRTHFSSVSVQQINTHFSFFGKCVAEQWLRPSLMDAQLAVGRAFSKDRKRVVVQGFFGSAFGRPLRGEGIRMTLNNRTIVDMLTDDQGFFKYSVKTSRFKKQKKLQVQVQALNDDTVVAKILNIRLRKA